GGGGYNSPLKDKQPKNFNPKHNQDHTSHAENNPNDNQKSKTTNPKQNPLDNGETNNPKHNQDHTSHAENNPNDNQKSKTTNPKQNPLDNGETNNSNKIKAIKSLLTEYKNPNGNNGLSGIFNGSFNSTDNSNTEIVKVLEKGVNTILKELNAPNGLTTNKDKIITQLDNLISSIQNNTYGSSSQTCTYPNCMNTSNGVLSQAFFTMIKDAIENNGEINPTYAKLYGVYNIVQNVSSIGEICIQGSGKDTILSCNNVPHMTEAIKDIIGVNGSLYHLYPATQEFTDKIKEIQPLLETLLSQNSDNQAIKQKIENALASIDSYNAMLKSTNKNFVSFLYNMENLIQAPLIGIKSFPSLNEPEKYRPTAPTKKKQEQAYQLTQKLWNEVSNIAMNIHNSIQLGQDLKTLANTLNANHVELLNNAIGSLTQLACNNKTNFCISNLKTSMQDLMPQDEHLPTWSFISLPPKLNTYNELQSSKPIALASLGTLASMFNQMNYL
ncbi:hypothetical protein, partial [Helicobacter cetorum]|uniref:hypothetical protein n=1 Tax=Helicobacter cetorum TaxID=138563 RepID=UPI001315A2E5